MSGIFNRAIFNDDIFNTAVAPPSGLPGNFFGGQFFGGGFFGSVAVVLPSQSTPGRIRLGRIPGQYHGEGEDEKRARRIREGTLPAPVSQPLHDTHADLSAYYRQSERLALAIAERRAESARLRTRIARLEADAQAAKEQREREAFEHRLLLAQQRLTLLAIQEAMLLEEMEAIDVAFFACVALVVILQ